MEANHNYVIRKINSDQLADVANIHIKAFPEAALSLFGPKIVRRYYEWQTKSPNECLAAGAFEGEKLLGFCFSGSFTNSEAGFIRENWGIFIKNLFNNPGLIFSIKVTARIREVFRSIIRQSKKRGEPRILNAKQIKKYGILSIAVDPNIQKKGIGQLLMENAYKDAIGKGFDAMRLTVHTDNVKAIAFYESEHWIKSYDEYGKWSGLMVKVLRENSRQSLG